MTTLTNHVAYLRALAVLDPETTMLQVAIIGALEELADAVDKPSDKEPPEHGFGSV
jgi:hypothetical protein